MKGTVMDHEHFDALARDIASVSRRAAFGVIAAGLAALAGPGIASEVEARKRGKKKRKGRCQPNCDDRTCGSDGCGGSCGACNAGQVCAGGTCCQPESRGATCASRCGTRLNTCGRPVACATCPAGQVCLSNGSCAIACTNNNDCDACGGGACADLPNIEGERHCTNDLVQPITTCAATFDCPPGSTCKDMGGGGVCVDLWA
jgi:hypothetical protein